MGYGCEWCGRVERRAHVPGIVQLGGCLEVDPVLVVARQLEVFELDVAVEALHACEDFLVLNTSTPAQPAHRSA